MSIHIFTSSGSFLFMDCGLMCVEREEGQGFIQAGMKTLNFWMEFGKVEQRRK